jgi:hypothetical protein
MWDICGVVFDFWLFDNIKSYHNLLLMSDSDVNPAEAIYSEDSDSDY